MRAMAKRAQRAEKEEKREKERKREKKEKEIEKRRIGKSTAKRVKKSSVRTVETTTEKL